MEYADLLSNYANLYRDKGDYAQAERLYQEVLALRLKLAGENHPDYGSALYSLGAVYLLQNKYEDSEKLLVKAADIFVRSMGKENLAYACVCLSLGMYTSGSRTIDRQSSNIRRLSKSLSV